MYSNFMYTLFFSLCVMFVSLPVFGQNKIDGIYDAQSNQFLTTDKSYHIDFFQHGVARIYRAGYIGLMDSTGAVLIPPKYDQVFDFQGDVAKVSLHRKFGLIHKSGKELLAPFATEMYDFVDGFAKTKVHFLETRIINTKGEFINAHIYDYLSELKNERFTFIRGNNFGLLTPQGEEIVVIENYNDQEYHQLVNYAHYGAGLVLDRSNYCNLFEFNEDRAITFAIVNDSVKFGCIDVNGKIVVPIKFDRIEPFKNGTALVKQNNLWGVIDQFGKIILPCNYESVQVVSENEFIVGMNEKLGVINRNGMATIQMNYQSIVAIPGARYIVSKGESYGVIDKNEKTVLPLDYPHLSYLFDGLLLTHNNKKWGVIELSKKKNLPFDYDAIVKFTDSTGIAIRYRSSYSLNTGIPRYSYQGTYSVFSKNGWIDKKSTPFSKTIEMIGDNYAPSHAILRGPSFFAPGITPDFNATFKQLTAYDFEQEITNGFLIVGTQTEPEIQTLRSLIAYEAQIVPYKKGIINASGEFVVPMIYDEINPERYIVQVSYFNMVQCAPRNLVIVRSGEKYGVINMKNEIIVPIEYDHIRLCSGIIELQKTTSEVDSDGYVEEYYAFGIADMTGKILVPVVQREYDENPINDWFADENRGLNK